MNTWPPTKEDSDIYSTIIGLKFQSTILFLGPSIEFMSEDMVDYYYYCLPFVYAMTHVAKVGSVFTTLAVSLERYFAVCKPLWIHIRRCHPANYIVSVIVFAFGFNIPKFMEFEVSLDYSYINIYRFTFM